MSTAPKARVDNLVIQEVENELLVYDLSKNKAICLNKTLAFVWQNCDGSTSVEEIALKLERHFQAKISVELIWFAVEQLNEENLLINTEDFPTTFAGMSRREVIRKVGFGAAVTLPLITSLVAPKAVAAQSVCVPNAMSCLANGAFCGSDSSICCSCSCQGGSQQCCAPGTTGDNLIGADFCAVDLAAASLNCCSGLAAPFVRSCPGGSTGFACIAAP